MILAVQDKQAEREMASVPLLSTVFPCPVDYSESIKLTDRLGELTIAL